MDAQIRFLDHEVGPDPLHQVTPRQDFAGSLHKRDEDIERAAAKGDGLSAALEQSRTGGQTKNCGPKLAILSPGGRSCE